MTAILLRESPTTIGRDPLFGRLLYDLDQQGTPQARINLDELLAAEVGGRTSPPVARVWTNERAIVVSQRTGIQSPTDVIDASGHSWPFCARGSGGSIVAHGPGVLNLSLILQRYGFCEPSIDAAYELWFRVVSTALKAAYQLEVQRQQVDGSFCAGRYDATVGGRKIGGVAQARRGHAIVVHGIILVAVDVVSYAAVLNAAASVASGSSLAHCDSERFTSLDEVTRGGVPVEDVAHTLLDVASLAPAHRLGRDG